MKTIQRPRESRNLLIQIQDFNATARRAELYASTLEELNELIANPYARIRAIIEKEKPKLAQLETDIWEIARLAKIDLPEAVKLANDLDGHPFLELLKADEKGHITVDKEAAEEYAKKQTAYQLNEKQTAAHKAATKIAHELNRFRNEYGNHPQLGQIVAPDHAGHWQVNEPTIITQIR